MNLLSFSWFNYITLPHPFGIFTAVWDTTTESHNLITIPMIFGAFFFPFKIYYLTKIKTKKKLCLWFIRSWEKPWKCKVSGIQQANEKSSTKTCFLLFKSQDTEYLIDNFESLRFNNSSRDSEMRGCHGLFFMQWWTRLVLHVPQHPRATLSVPYTYSPVLML